MRRKKLRLADYHYSVPGAYFITICVQNRRSLLSTIQGPASDLSSAGQLVSQSWEGLPDHYSYIQLDDFVVMPNHIHGLLWIRDLETNTGDVGAGFKPAPTRHGLSEIVRGFKTFSARRINETLAPSPKFVWQRSFYEHIIRDEADLFNHRQYILENPARWQTDEYRV